MASTSRSVKPEREVVKDEDEDEDTFPFDLDSTNTNLEDPLGDCTGTDNALKSEDVEIKAKEEFGDKNSISSGTVKYVKRLKVFIIPEATTVIPQVMVEFGGRRRKYATQEERLRAKAEQARQRRAKMPKEKREEILRKEREAARLRRAKMKEEASKVNETDHFSSEFDEESNSKSRYEEWLKDNRERSRKRKEEIKNDPDKFEEFKKKRRENYRRRREQNPEKYEEQKRKRIEYEKKRREENPPERLEEIRRKHREAVKRWRERNPEKYEERRRRLRKENLTEEEIERRRIKKRLYAEKNRERVRFAQYSRIQMQIAQMTDEELAALKAKRREYAKKWRESLTGEKLEKYRTYLRNNAKGKYHKRLATLGEAYKAKINARYRHYVANETSEQRQRRLRRYKINQAITRLRKQLEEVGLSPEEVETRVMELKRTMEAEPLPPPETLSKYKPRVKSVVNFSFPPRSYEGRRRGRPTGSSSSRLVSNSNCETSCDGQGQHGMGSFEINNSNDFDDDGFQCDLIYDDKIKTDSHRETTTVDPEPVPILPFDIKCPHCPSTYSERTDLISHIGSEHSQICWKCPKCKLIVLSSDELSDHYKTEHLPMSKGLTATTTSDSASKETSQMTEKKFTCIKCDLAISPDSFLDRTFQCVKDLMDHVKSCHPQSFWPCSKCNILKYSESALKLHEKVCKRLGRRIKFNGRK